MWKEVYLFIYLNIEMVNIAKGENSKKKDVHHYRHYHFQPI